ncbi:undecaprenyl-diphosphate phosphatase [bacterium]|nr:undecaprenyl-diphosphate phosphatase [bacterium]MBP9807857.1 undecaprenyl-diphosphate phosphatase [bacterium]
MAEPVSLVEALTLGVVQGLTEFLPISSTAHLRVVPALLHWQDPGAAYSAVIQLGSVVAVFAYFFKDLVSISTGALGAIKNKDYGDRDLRMVGAIIVGTIPICVIGLLLKPLLEQDNGPFRSVNVIACASIVMGLLLVVAEKFAKHVRGLDDITGKDGALVGLAQAIALIPGCSRSGSTLTMAMLLGLKRAEAARFSFLLGIPAVTLAGLLELYHMVKDGLGNDSTGLTSLAVGLVSSTVVSYLSIAWLIRYLQQHNTWVFVGYRLIFGVSVLILSMNGLIH